MTVAAGRGPLHGLVGDTGYVLPEGLSYEDWASEGPTLVWMAQSAPWWLGDWLRYGERRWPDVYAQAVEASGLSVQTLQNYQWVADRIPPAERVQEVPFSHHRAVAALEPAQRSGLLERARDEHMTEGEVRGRVRQIKEGGAAPLPEAPPEPNETLAAAAPEVVRELVQAEASRSWERVHRARDRLERALSRDALGER